MITRADAAIDSDEATHAVVNGWPLFGLLAAVETALFAGAWAGFGNDEPGLRALTRFTVRVSFVVFAVVYAAAPLRRLFPSPATRWIARYRRFLGVSFAWAHGLHALAIALLAHRIGDAFAPTPVSLIGGGYVNRRRWDHFDVSRSSLSKRRAASTNARTLSRSLRRLGRLVRE